MYGFIAALESISIVIRCRSAADSADGRTFVTKRVLCFLRPGFRLRVKLGDICIRQAFCSDSPLHRILVYSLYNYLVILEEDRGLHSGKLVLLMTHRKTALSMGES
jgi:hypothetical protein